jgi:predicted nuclease of predicted toxin-antitoxin system
MKILLDESVSLRLAPALRRLGHDVTAIAELNVRGQSDEGVWHLATDEQALLITRDYHFTNALRFDPARCLGIIFIRHGNLSAADEMSLVQTFLEAHPLHEFQGRLVTLSPGSVRIR